MIGFCLVLLIVFTCWGVFVHSLVLLVKTRRRNGYFCRYFINEPYVLLGMSANNVSAIECVMVDVLVMSRRTIIIRKRKIKTFEIKHLVFRFLSLHLQKKEKDKKNISNYNKSHC